MGDWDLLNEPTIENPDAMPVDIEMVRITAARELVGLPLGCRLELVTSFKSEEFLRVSIGFKAKATFNAEEWAAMVFCYETSQAGIERFDEWLQHKRLSRGQWKAYMDKGVDFTGAGLRERTFTTMVGDVVDAFGLTITRVVPEL